jgi:NIPSNAP
MLDRLSARFRDHTTRIFEANGIEVIGFWEPIDDEGRKTGTFVYLLAFESQAARDASWVAFKADPEWLRVFAESEADGRLMASGVGVLMKATDYSPIA